MKIVGAIILVVLVCGYFVMMGVAFLNPADSDPAGEAREALAKINEYRATENQAALTWDNELELLAVEHSQYMLEADRFEHSTHPYVECILQGAGTGERIAELWEGSPAHYQIMMSKSIQSGAVGISGSYATFMAR